MYCEHFARTGIKLSAKHTIADECNICPLRNKNGDCIKDIIDNYGLGIEVEISEIWRKYYEDKNRE